VWRACIALVQSEEKRATPRPKLRSSCRAWQNYKLFLIIDGEVRVSIPGQRTELRRRVYMKRKGKRHDQASALSALQAAPPSFANGIPATFRTLKDAKRHKARTKERQRRQQLDAARTLEEARSVFAAEGGSIGRLYGAQVDVALMGPGSILGLQDALYDSPISTMTATTASGVRALVLPREALMEKLPALPVRGVVVLWCCGVVVLCCSIRVGLGWVVVAT